MLLVMPGSFGLNQKKGIALGPANTWFGHLGPQLCLRVGWWRLQGNGGGKPGVRGPPAVTPGARLSEQCNAQGRS